MTRALMAVLTLAAWSVLGGTAAAELKAGDAAPAFSLPGSDGKTYRLEGYRGRQTVVLAWFAKAFTGG